ncbi:PH domain-containing protein [Alteromonas sp. CYL-A6]|uniref:PH domain-containing protein n=1 Tax=Alteromonas nitratireducens TaxID=3390813 RepID=UPI0034B2988B
MEESVQGSDFSNEAVSEQALPALQQLVLEPVSVRYRQVNMSVAALVTLLVLLLIQVAIRQPFFPLPDPLIVYAGWASIVVFCLGALWLTYHYLADPLVRFSVRQQDISLSSGLVFRSLVCQPILRVQHVQIKRGPIARLTGLATLQVYSAGGSSHTFEIPGLPYEKAAQLRQFILDHRDISAR